jgi:acetyl esterase/lipase
MSFPRILMMALVSLPLTFLSAQDPIGVPDVLALPASEPDGRHLYGLAEQQFGDLRLPEGEGPFPVVVIIHGGCWLSAYGLDLMDGMATELTAKGYATWNLEYRRVGDEGGGWPGTFLDVAAGTDHLRTLAERFPLDLARVVVVGHSAGGHLALWLASRAGLPADSPIRGADPLPLAGVVSLAGITDLEAYLVREGRACGTSVDELVGGLPELVPERYAQASPIARLPLGVPRVLITGDLDRIVPLSHVAPYVAKAETLGDPVVSRTAAGAGHFELIAPGTPAWEEVELAISELLTPVDDDQE